MQIILNKSTSPINGRLITVQTHYTTVHESTWWSLPGSVSSWAMLENSRLGMYGIESAEDLKCGLRDKGKREQPKDMARQL